MKRTDRLTTIIGAILFLAVVAYAFFYARHYLDVRVVTVPAVTTTVRESAAAPGIVIRSETVISHGGGYIDVLAGEGKKVSMGETCAVSYTNEDSLESASRIRQLELEIKAARDVLEKYLDEDDIKSRDDAVKDAVRKLAASVARRELVKTEESAMLFSALVFKGTSSITWEDVYALEAELQVLTSYSGSGAAEIKAPAPGTFSSAVDGYEHLNPSLFGSLEPESLRQAGQDKREAPDAVGKLVTEHIWYFAAVMNSSDASKLETGDSVRLDFGGYTGLPISAAVFAVNREVGGERVVVFVCDKSLAQTLNMRNVSAKVIWSEHEGLEVPASAVWYDEDGTPYVFTRTGIIAERRDIDIIWDDGGDFVLAKISDSAGALRSGNEIITKASDLYDGKVLG